MLHSFLVFLHESVEELIHFQEAANTSHKYFVFPLRNIIFSRSNNNNKNVWTGSLVCVSSFSKISAELLPTHEKKYSVMLTVMKHLTRNPAQHREQYITECKLTLKPQAFVK